MPTGPKHELYVQAVHRGEEIVYGEDCRCMLGKDHYDDPDNPWGERLGLFDAADIWKSSGMDEDYMFGYGDDQLRQYL